MDVYSSKLLDPLSHLRRRVFDDGDSMLISDLDLPGRDGGLDDDVDSVTTLNSSEGHGCGLPGTPDEDHFMEADLLSDDVNAVVNHVDVDPEVDDIDCTLASRVAEQAELVRKVWEMSWKVTHFRTLPQWLQDNDFLHKGHRPPLPSFYACFKSIFRIHTETGNIWTHLLGCIAFIGVAGYFLTRPSVEIQLQEKIVFAFFFLSAIICLGLSSMFHTMHCHSPKIGKLFSRLDYCGIAILITGSFIPWLYYGFYCYFQPRLIYLSAVLILGITSVVVSLWEKFGEPKFRWLRAGVFMTFGLSGIVPAIHYLITEGFFIAVYEASLGWLALMGLLYVIGAVFYAFRVPERFFPGKFDIWFQSHQIFHVLVIAAAFVHFHGISNLAMYRLTAGECAFDDSEYIDY